MPLRYAAAYMCSSTAYRSPARAGGVQRAEHQAVDDDQVGRLGGDRVEQVAAHAGVTEDAEHGERRVVVQRLEAAGVPRPDEREALPR